MPVRGSSHSDSAIWRYGLNLAREANDPTNDVLLLFRRWASDLHNICRAGVEPDSGSEDRPSPSGERRIDCFVYQATHRHRSVKSQVVLSYERGSWEVCDNNVARIL